MIKPSELVPETAALLRDLVAETFPPDQVTVVTGGPEVGEAFSRLPFDHLVFTGSTRVGKIVMRAASENLVPVTLELGGKSPTIVANGLQRAHTAAERIMAGKLFNAGQTCIAPDYVMVPGRDARRLRRGVQGRRREDVPDAREEPRLHVDRQRQALRAAQRATWRTRRPAARASSS